MKMNRGKMTWLRTLLAGLLLFGFHQTGEAIKYDSSAPVDHGGHYLLVLSNRDSIPRRIQVRVTAYDKDQPGRTFEFPVQTVDVPAAERNPFTNDLAKAGAKMVNFKLLKEITGFSQYARVHTEIITDGTPPGFSCVMFITDDHEGNVIYYGDIRQFRVTS